MKGDWKGRDRRPPRVEREYTVRWEIDVEATSYEDAARKVTAILDDPSHGPWVYEIARKDRVQPGTGRDGDPAFKIVDMADLEKEEE